MLKNKKVMIGTISSICGIALISLIIIFANKSCTKRDKLKEIQQSIENIFFYLPNNEYDNLNDIPDYCKVSLVFGQSYMKADTYLDISDYDTEVKKETDKSVKAFKKDTILKNVKNLLGKETTINFDMDEDMDYQFLEENGCGFNNKYISTLSYNEEKEYIYSLKEEKEKSYELYVEWDNPVEDNNQVTLTAKALITRKNDDGSYDVYADPENKYLAGTIKNDEDFKSEMDNLIKLKSRKYIFTLKKEKGNYIWTNYKISDYLYNAKKIVD